MRSVAVVSFVIASLLLTPFGIAPSHPDFIDVTPGVNPDSPFYTFDVLWDNIRVGFAGDAEAKAKLTAEISAERFAEMQAMLESNNLQAAERAGTEEQKYLEKFKDHVQSISKADVDPLVELEKFSIFNNQYADSIDSQLRQKVAAGEVTEEQAKGLATDKIVRLSVDAQANFEEKKGEILTDIATQQGIPVIEAEIIYETKAQSAGVLEKQRDAVAEDLTKARETIASLEEQYKALPKDSQDRVALTNMIEKAKLNLQIAEDSFKLGDYGKAFGRFTAGQHMIFNADRFLGNELTPEETEKLKAEFSNFDAIQKDVERQAAKFAEEFEKHKDYLREKYPEKLAVIEKQFEQSKKVMELATKLADDYQKQFESLVSEGKSTAEATQILTAKFADEYRKAYGEEFIPPGFVVGGEHEFDPADIEKFGDKKIISGAGGGFVVGKEYQDPVSGYKYEFSENGWKYTTSAGETYEQKYPEGYIPPKAYAKGNEVYNYKISTSEGEVEYKYTATGYEIVKPDGTKEGFAYDPGKYKLPDGSEIEHKATGYELKTAEGGKVKYDYDPKFDSYVSKDGTVFKPPEGAYIHDNVKYQSDKKDYVFEHGGEKWNYNPTAGTWQSSKGESYRPEAKLVAPVGHEDQQSYTTAAGEKWTYDTSAGKWQSSAGEVYNSASGEFKSTTGATTKHEYKHSEAEYKYVEKTASYTYVDPKTGATYSTTYKETTETREGYQAPTPSGEYQPSTQGQQTPTESYPTPSPTQSPTQQSPTSSSGESPTHTSPSGTSGSSYPTTSPTPTSAPTESAPSPAPSPAPAPSPTPSPPPA